MALAHTVLLSSFRNADRTSGKSGRRPTVNPVVAGPPAAPSGTPLQAPASQFPSGTSRRAWLATITSLAAAALVQAPPPAAAAASSASEVAAAEAAAASAYANRDFEAALAALDELVRQEPQELRWREMRAQVGVDGAWGREHACTPSTPTYPPTPSQWYFTTL